MPAPIAAVSGVMPTTGPLAPGALSAASVATPAEANAFSSALSGAIENIQGKQDLSSDLAVKAVTGELENVHDYTIAATEAAVSLELAVAVRNRLVDAFTEIMRMQA